jgi:hypothetical protein
VFSEDLESRGAPPSPTDPEHPWSDLPDGFDYPPVINDAFDDAPIVGPFLPPDAPLPKWPAKWGDPPRVIGDG